METGSDNAITCDPHGEHHHWKIDPERVSEDLDCTIISMNRYTPIILRCLKRAGVYLSQSFSIHSKTKHDLKSGIEREQGAAHSMRYER